MSNRFIASTLFVTLALLAACSNYDFTLNDRVIYTPDPLFTDYDVPDKGLRECIKEAINYNKVSYASEPKPWHGPSTCCHTEWPILNVHRRSTGR